jgi:hypothetical protein
MPGLDESLEKNDTEKKVTSIQKNKNKRNPFHYWTVAGNEHKMKLNASMTTKLEETYRSNITSLVMTDNPTLGVMLTIAQAAIAPWEHGTKYNDVENMYNAYLDEGGNMQNFLTDIIIPTLCVSGFFTDSQMEKIRLMTEEMKALG